MTGSEAGKTYNDHNVYILGAGFGAEADLPLIKDFMNRMRDAGLWLEGQTGREREQGAISRVLEFRLRAAAAAHRVPLNVENIEELFSLASATGDEELAAAMPLAIAATLDYARQTAKPPEVWQSFQIGVVNLPEWTRPPKWNDPLPYVREEVGRGDRKGSWYSCPPYDFYVGVMAGYFNKGGSDRRDTIITFNYDTLIEDALDGLVMKPDYSLRAQANPLSAAGAKVQGVAILKLHGSVNWVAGSESWANNNEDLVHSVQRELARRIEVKPYAECRTSGWRPLLMPPTWRKVAHPALSQVWDAAVAALRRATNVIILGYSVPNTDQHFRYLIAAGLQDSISLRKIFFVNPALADETQAALLKDRLFGPGGLSALSCMSRESSSFCRSTRANFLPGHTVSTAGNRIACGSIDRLTRKAAPLTMRRSGSPIARRTWEPGGDLWVAHRSAPENVTS